MEGIKTFPIVLTIDHHKKIKEAAAKIHLSMNKFFLEAVDEKIQRESVK